MTPRTGHAAFPFSWFSAGTRGRSAPLPGPLPLTFAPRKTSEARESSSGACEAARSTALSRAFAPRPLDMVQEGLTAVCAVCGRNHATLPRPGREFTSRWRTERDAAPNTLRVRGRRRRQRVRPGGFIARRRRWRAQVGADRRRSGAAGRDDLPSIGSRLRRPGDHDLRAHVQPTVPRAVDDEPPGWRSETWRPAPGLYCP